MESEDMMYEMNPSEMIARIRELKSKQDYEGISKEEQEELINLKEILNDSFGDYQDDIFLY